MVEALTKENFHEKIKQGLCIVDFWAEWCGPCKQLAPIYEEVSQDPDLAKLTFYKFNTEESQEIGAEQGVRGIPCLIIFKDGQQKDMLVGFMEKEQLKSKILEALEKA